MFHIFKKIILIVLALCFFREGFSEDPSLIAPEEQALFDQGKTYADLENREVAIFAFEQLLSKYPVSIFLPEAHLYLSDLHKEREPKKAISFLKAFLEKFPEDDRINDARMRLSELYLARGEFNDVLQLWDPVPDEETYKAEAYDKLAQAYFVRKEYGKSLEVLMLKKKLVFGPEELQGVRNAVVALIRERLHEKELESVVKQFAPGFPADEAMIRLIGLYEERGDYYREERYIKRFLSSSSDHPFSGAARGMLGQIRDKTKASRHLIAVILPLSGKLAPFGEAALNGTQMALQQFKEENPGASVGLVVKDIEEDRKGIEGWLDEYRSVAVVGPLLSKDVDYVAPMVERGQRLLITPGATASHLTSLGRSVIRNAITNRYQCHALAEHAVHQMGLKQFAVLFPKENFGMGWMKCFSEEVIKLGGEMVHAEPYLAGDTDFSSAIRRLKEIDLGKKGISHVVEEGKRKREISYTPGFGGLFLPGSAESVGLLIPQLAFHNIKDVVLLGVNSWNSPDFLKMAGFYAEGAVFMDGFFKESPDPAVQKFVAQYRKRFHEEPDIFSAQAYDATSLILSAVKEGAYTPWEIKTKVGRIRQFRGASGFISEIKEGEVVKRPFLLKVQRGRFVQIN